MIVWVLVAAIVAGMAYIRLAPSDPDRWHKQAKGSGMGEIRSDRSFIWREALEGDGIAKLRELDGIVMKTPRTTRLAGSVDDGQITYISRSQFFGFPDYTTIGVYDGLNEDTDQRYFEISGRARFGRSDLGVNAKRIKGWLAAVE